MGAITPQNGQTVQSTTRLGSDAYNPSTEGWGNKDFASLAANNPVLQYQYTPGWWDKIGNFFGFRTGEDKWRDDTAAKAADYEAQLRQLDAQQQYNSAEEQAQRMRDAGINPNLSGGVTPGEAGEFDNQAVAGQDTPKGATMGEVNNMFLQGLNVATSAISTVGSAVTTAISMMEKLQNYKIKEADENEKRRKDIFQFFHDYMVNRMSINDKTQQAFDEQYGGFENEKGKFLNSERVKNLWNTKKERNIAWEAWQYWQNMPSIIADRYEEGSRQSKAYIEGYQGISNYVSMPEEAMRDVSKFYWTTYKLMHKYQADYFTGANGGYKALSENSKYKWDWQYFTNLNPVTDANAVNFSNKYAIDYWNTANGTLKGQRENAMNQAAIKTAEIQQGINGAFANLISGLSLKAANPHANLAEKLMYTTILKNLGDAFNTNFIQEGIDTRRTWGAAAINALGK